ncbi:MAG TPA: hypothetical protein VHA78_01630 [Candidatus Peribacteraceae bacterium]|nr:hypothetical protein [Candidatus Peribacteraceae bacterium]
MAADDWCFYDIASENADPTYTLKLTGTEETAETPQESAAADARLSRIHARILHGHEQIAGMIPFEEIDG